MTSTYTCTCGRELSFYSIASHLKSKIHKELLNTKLKEIENLDKTKFESEYVLFKKK